MSASPAAGAVPLISLRNITKVYGEGQAAMHALRGIDIDIEPGAFSVAYVANHSNSELPLIYRGMPLARRHARAREALVAVGLSGWESHSSAELSGGQQQRVAIARALVTEPAVLLADEPTGNLDTARSLEIMELLTRLNAEQGITIVMVTHEAEMAAYARRAVHFLDGRVDGGQSVENG